MLNIYFGDMPEAIYDTASYFNNVYLDSWAEEDLTEEILKAIDNAEVLSPQAVNSKALGVIPMTGISGGAKTLLLVHHFPKKVFNASTCGDNCAKWLLIIASLHKEDITVNLRHLMNFDPMGRDIHFEIRIANTGEIVHDMKEYVLAGGSLLGEEDAE